MKWPSHDFVASSYVNNGNFIHVVINNSVVTNDIGEGTWHYSEQVVLKYLYVVVVQVH